MRLELKHLAPYLPYDIGCVIPLGYHRTLDVNILQIMIKENFFKCYLKLRPLSDLTKEIEHNGESFVPIDYLEDMIDFSCGYERIEYWKVQQLIEWHFDVFGLISAGLAIDINTLNSINEN